jgi:hypothetical protein
MRGNGRVRVLAGRKLLTVGSGVKMGESGTRGQDSARNRSAEPDLEVAALLPC